jgi:hypothetical protein
MASLQVVGTNLFLLRIYVHWGQGELTPSLPPW